MTTNRLDPTGLTLDVCTRREGVLARVGHDLRIRATGVRLEHDASGLVVAVPVSGLGVVAVRTPRGDDATKLSSADRATIERHLREDVLDAASHPEIVASVRARAEGRAVAARIVLVLRGSRQELDLTLHRSTDGAWAGAVTFAPSRFGIAPFRAMMGALRVADEVTTDVRVAATLAARLSEALGVETAQGS